MSVEISFQTSAKRKRSTSMRIIGKGRVEAKIPVHISINFLATMISNNQRFLTKSLKFASQSTVPEKLQTGDELFIFGQRFLIEVLPGKQTRVAFDLDSKVCSIKSSSTSVSIASFYKSVSRILLPEIEKYVSRFSIEMGPLKPTRIGIKMTRSQWGSCTSTNKLSFSKKLIHYPQEVINYVIIHELAHLYQKNHSEKFWKIVADHCPNHKELKRQLKEHKYG